MQQQSLRPFDIRKIRLPKEGEKIVHKGKSYYIGPQIGKGSFGVVFGCTDEWGNDLVAKVLLPRNRAYEAVKTSWNSEIKNLLSLRHPNITYIYDAFELNNSFYLIIERCSHTINNLINSKNFKGDRFVLPVARCLLQAIEFIHSYEYVHLDIHVGNIFTAGIEDEAPPDNHKASVFKLGDLGITRLAADIDILHTIIAEWMIPPEFLNPGKFGAVGRQMDIYHCGLIFLSLLCGRLLKFTKEEILTGRPEKVAELLGSPYGPVIAQALRPHTNMRTKTALEFWHGLEDAAGSHKISH